MSLLARVLVLTVGLCPVLQAQTAPSTPLPAIDITALPGAAKEAISGAYDEARAHPDNVEAVGRLAITLHAWEQWDAAAATYRVAQRLAPKDRRWWYLDGLLETARGRHARCAAVVRARRRTRP